MKFRRPLKILPPLAIGIGVALWLMSGAEPPQRSAHQERSVTARTMTVKTTPLAPVVRGFGTVRAAQSWQAVAEVSGAITFRHPDLETGNVIPAGTRVLEIDPSRYETALQEAQADLNALKAENEQIDIEAANTNNILTIEAERLALATADLNRVRTLTEQGATSQARLDEQERITLQLRRTVQELENNLALVPVQKARLDARIARTEATLDRAERDLNMTSIVTPFNLRVGTVHVERYQFVTSGQSLVAADGIARAEITAHLPIDSFPRLMGAAANAGVQFDADHLPQVLERISAELKLISNPGQVRNGRVLRIENALDPQARSVPVVIAVDDPYKGARPPAHLPLVPNMYVEVILTAPPGNPRIALPVQAVHQGDTVYLRNTDGRLELRNVTVGWRQADLAIIEDGLTTGEEVIVDDIVPALPGLRIVPAETGE
ncbi:Multidrug resistance efflux pump [Roseovarius pacificus]|uniref:Multidrug resistance efflux pump n=1 Tax=Roseovarius pacificus TaxID=337701 RepID=A0A1M7DWR8_9RHOB|nr:hypothetical protein [Roseovarius pacificus]GGO57171.1 hypothetical protein GCM10011315_23720 [Roseovarius pacificus]SHL83952.1 Multidrug resistance efflux pump [Roseovarius pacificus]